MGGRIKLVHWLGGVGVQCHGPWYDLDLTFNLAVLTLSLKTLSGLYLRNSKV